MPERVKKDPIVQLVEALDRARRWQLYMAIVIALLTIAVMLLAFGYFGLDNYVHNSRKDRIAWQCRIETHFGMEKTSCL